MIYEIRTYRLTPGSLAEVEKRFAEAYEYRRKYSPLAAFWHTEIGPLNEIVHVWPYADLAERARVRAEAVEDPHWPPKILKFVVRMKSDILTPFPFLPEIRPRKLGPIFEMRSYRIKPGTLPDLMKRWQSAIGPRVKLSPLALAGIVELGEVNTFIHVWAYRSLNQRMAIRARARASGVWPPPGGGGSLVTQSTKVLLPAAFSPLQ